MEIRAPIQASRSNYAHEARPVGQMKRILRPHYGVDAADRNAEKKAPLPFMAPPRQAVRSPAERHSGLPGGERQRFQKPFR